MLRWVAAALLILVAALGFVAWQRYAAAPTQNDSPATTGTPQGSAGTLAEGPGVEWTVPAAWVSGPSRPMRIATYAIGDAECAVFHFGPDQGGSVDENIDRWSGQFEGSPNPKREVRAVGGMKLTRVEIDGTFLSPGSDMQSQGRLPGWRMLGAIVQGPQGPVFFKLVGPSGTVRGAAHDFDTMLAGLTVH